MIRFWKFSTFISLKTILGDHKNNPRYFYIEVLNLQFIISISAPIRHLIICCTNNSRSYFVWSGLADFFGQLCKMIAKNMLPFPADMTQLTITQVMFLSSWLLTNLWWQKQEPMFSYVPLLWNQSETPPKRHYFLIWFSACFQHSMETQVHALPFLKNENWQDISSTRQHWWCSKCIWLFNEIPSFFTRGWHPQLSNKPSLLNSSSQINADTRHEQNRRSEKKVW